MIFFKNTSNKKVVIKRGFFAHLSLLFFQKLSGLLLHEHFIRKELLQQQEHCILCANHITFIDALWISKLLSPHQLNHFAVLGGADLLTDYGYLGKILAKIAPMLPVDRKGNPIRGLLKAKKFLEQNNSILLIHPEGTRSTTGRLEYMHQGAPLLAFKGKLPLVPVYIHGAYSIWKKGQKFPSFFQKAWKRKSITLEVGEAFYPDHYEHPEALSEAMRQWFYQKEQEYLN